MKEKPHTCRRIGALWYCLRFSTVVLWLVVYKCACGVPRDLRPMIDVSTLPDIEYSIFGWLFNGFPHQFFSFYQCPLEDIFAAIVYTFHFVAPVVFAIWLAKQQGWREVANFACALGFMNLVAEIAHFLYPTAPPWYFEMHGTFPANYMHHGHPAGLARLDTQFNFNFFNSIYESSPVVFGAFPSLHAGWPFLMAIFKPSWGKFSWFYVAWVSWAALYLQHHFLLDVLGGYLFAYIGLIVTNPSRRSLLLGTSVPEPTLPYSKKDCMFCVASSRFTSISQFLSTFVHKKRPHIPSSKLLEV